MFEPNNYFGPNISHPNNHMFIPEVAEQTRIDVTGVKGTPSTGQFLASNTLDRDISTFYRFGSLNHAVYI